MILATNHRKISVKHITSDTCSTICPENLLSFPPFCISPHLAIQNYFDANGGASEFERTKTISGVLDKQT